MSINRQEAIIRLAATMPELRSKTVDPIKTAGYAVNLMYDLTETDIVAVVLLLESCLRSMDFTLPVYKAFKQVVAKESPYDLEERSEECVCHEDEWD